MVVEYVSGLSPLGEVPLGDDSEGEEPGPAAAPVETVLDQAPEPEQLECDSIWKTE